MNLTDIENFVQTRSSVARQVFSSVIANPSKATQAAAKATGEKKIRKYVQDAGFPLSGSLMEVLPHWSIRDLWIVVEAENHKEAKSPAIKLLRLNWFTSWLPNVVLSYIFDLKLNSLPLEQQHEAGDGLFLACLYLYLKDANHE